jgi:hypothetical protein
MLFKSAHTNKGAGVSWKIQVSSASAQLLIPSSLGDGGRAGCALDGREFGCPVNEDRSASKTGFMANPRRDEQK